MFCQKCGKEIKDGATFCPSCGANQSVSPNNQQYYNQPNYNQPNYNQPNYNQPNYNQPNYNQPNYNQPNYNQPNYNQYASSDSSTLAIVGYITWIGFFIALISNKNNDPFVKFHLNQALILNLCALVTFIPFIGLILGICVFVLWIIALISAVNKQCTPVPVVGNIKLI